ncbi:MAG: hypothetical protein O7C67_13700 [Gammaproteobacteria bacterium]|nr:hypothetical protein [Gammaproteobacteria bacterium]
MAEASQSVPFAESPLARVARLHDVIREGGDEAQNIRRLPSETADSLIDEGFYRFALPLELGGENASVTETIEILEAIAAIDGSVGWNVMIGSEINAIAAGGMPPEIAKEVYLDNPRVIMCGGGGPGTIPAGAVKQSDGSFRVSGQATFMSGCHNAEWCFMMAPTIEDGAPRLDAAGQPIIKLWFLNRSEWQIEDTWDVAGLRGSGSHDVVADGALVPARLAPVELFALPAHYPNPVFRIPVALRLSYNKAAVAIGIARGALNAFADIAQNKVPLMSASTLKDRPVAQYRMGEGEATLRAARAFLMETMGAVEAELTGNANQPGPETTKLARLACTYAANTAMHVVDSVHNAAGTTALRMDCLLERKLRDVHGCATHRWVSHQLYTELGKMFLGDPGLPEFSGSGEPQISK